MSDVSMITLNQVSEVIETLVNSGVNVKRANLRQKYVNVSGVNMYIPNALECYADFEKSQATLCYDVIITVNSPFTHAHVKNVVTGIGVSDVKLTDVINTMRVMQDQTQVRS